MPASPAQLDANRSNCLLSTGPRTAAGLARVSQNALKVGLFARALVVPTLGESAEEYDAFRRSVVGDLNPVGAFEVELAERIAGLMWRLRRVARYEAAAMSASVGELPPHPDAVAPLTGNGVFLPLPQDATTTFRLARLRAHMLGSSNAIGSRRAGADALGAAARTPVDLSAALRVLDAAAAELDWDLVPDPWPAVLTAAGCTRHRADAVRWTGRRLRRVLKVAAGTADRTFGEFRRAVRERLERAAEDLERVAAERHTEEDRLVEELLHDRERAAAARVYADDGLVQRVGRAEGHLSRELDRALALLAGLRAGRVHEPAAIRAVGFVRHDGVTHEPPELPPIGAG